MSETLSPDNVTAAVLAVAPRVGTAVPTPSAQPPAAEPQTAQAETTAKEPLKDRAGREFDAKRFRTNPDGSPYLNGKGLFMPRGGRKPKGATLPGSAPIASPAVSPAADPWSASDRAAAATPPPVAQPGEPEASAQPQGAPPPVGSSTDAAEVGCRVAYTLTGLALGVPEESTPPAAEHKNYVETVAKYFDYRGWRFVGGVALCFLAAAYVLRLISKPKVEKRLRDLFGGSSEPELKNVTPAPEISAEPEKSKVPPPAAVPPIIPPANEPVQFTKPFVPPMP
ncbi:MAG: hypothetical protein QM715_18605 [Nibricoccus sp.]